MSAFAIPVRDLPAAVLSAVTDAGVRPLLVRGEATVGTAFVAYTPGGVLQYNELLTAVAVLRGRSLLYTIPDIWVDSRQSQAGGRELWGIPKDLADFERDASPTATHTRMTVGGTAVGSLGARIGPSLAPGVRQVPLPTAQFLGGRTTVARNRVLTRLRHMRAEWAFDPHGRLGYLAGRRPRFSVALDEAAVIFGAEVTRS